MKKIICLFIILLSMPVLAALPDIVALVNDQPITKHDFESRKKMLVVLNGIDTSDYHSNIKLNNDILNMLIDEKILNQHAEKIGAAISEKELDNAISTIDKRNNMPDGGMYLHLKKNGLDTDSFRQQIQGELIRSNIVDSLHHSVSISETELDTALISNNIQDVNIEALIFTAIDNSDIGRIRLQRLAKRLSSCDDINQNLYKRFATVEKFVGKMSDMSGVTQSIAVDTNIGNSSSVYYDDSFKLLFVCKKDRIIASNNLNQVKSFLSNKKLSYKAMKFFSDLRAKAYIKIMLPN